MFHFLRNSFLYRFSIRNWLPNETRENYVEGEANNSNFVACEIVNDVTSVDKVDVAAELGATSSIISTLVF